jgi:hypothetical protein
VLAAACLLFLLARMPSEIATDSPDDLMPSAGVTVKGLPPAPPPQVTVTVTATVVPLGVPTVAVKIEPTNTPVPPTATAVPTATPVAVGAAGCELEVPPELDWVESSFWLAFQDQFCEGDLIVLIIRCEGWNAFNQWSLTRISDSGDVGPAQINQVHGQPDGNWPGEWPQRFQTLEGNRDAALTLRAQSGSYFPWKNSRHCHGVA